MEREPSAPRQRASSSAAGTPCASCRGTRRSTPSTCATAAAWPAWSVAALLHAVYHALNLDAFGAGDAIALTAVLVSVLALPVLAIVITCTGVRRGRA